GEPVDLARELAPRERVPAAVLRQEDRRLLVGPLARPAMHAALDDVELGADEPLRPLDPGRLVEDALPGLGEPEPEILDHRGPESLRLSYGEALQLVVVRAAEPAREPRHVRLLDELGARCPDEAAHRTNDICRA